MQMRMRMQIHSKLNIWFLSINSRDPRLRGGKEDIGVRADLHYIGGEEPGVSDLGYDAMAKYFNIVLREKFGEQNAKTVSLNITKWEPWQLT